MDPRQEHRGLERRLPGEAQLLREGHEVVEREAARAVAEEVVQEVFLYAWRSAASGCGR